MENKSFNKVHRVNCLAKDMNALYHRAARILGVSDSELSVLYMIYEKGDRCRLYDICNESGISKQTINSALRRLEGEGAVYLEQSGGKAKLVCLTEKGNALVKKTAARLFKAESDAFKSWAEEDFEAYLRLMEKYNHSLRAQLENMQCENNNNNPI